MYDVVTETIHVFFDSPRLRRKFEGLVDPDSDVGYVHYEWPSRGDIHEPAPIQVLALGTDPDMRVYALEYARYHEVDCGMYPRVLRSSDEADGAPADWCGGDSKHEPRFAALRPLLDRLVAGGS